MYVAFMNPVKSKVNVLVLHNRYGTTIIYDSFAYARHVLNHTDWHSIHTATIHEQTSILINVHMMGRGKFALSCNVGPDFSNMLKH